MYKKWNRIGAGVIDNSIIVVLISFFRIIIMIFFGWLLALKGEGAPIDILYDFLKIIFWLTFAVLVAVNYNLLLNKRYKQTLGQMLLRVHIIDKKSTQKKIIYPNKKQLQKREYYKWTLMIGTFYMYGIFCIAQILISKELYHNKVANTQVEVWI